MLPSMRTSKSCTSWKRPIARPNCCRSWAYFSASSYAPRAQPTASPCRPQDRSAGRHPSRGDLLQRLGRGGGRYRRGCWHRHRFIRARNCARRRRPTPITGPITTSTGIITHLRRRRTTHRPHPHMTPQCGAAGIPITVGITRVEPRPLLRAADLIGSFAGFGRAAPFVAALPHEMLAGQLCQRNCCGFRADPWLKRQLTSAGPLKFIASSSAPFRFLGSSI